MAPPEEPERRAEQARSGAPRMQPVLAGVVIAAIILALALVAFGWR